MPFRRRRIFRRARRFTRRPRQRRFRARVARVVQSVAEHKHADFTATSYWASIGNTWTDIDLLNAIQTGADPHSNRIGNKISVTSLYIKGTVFGGAIGTVTGDDLYNSLRYVIYTAKYDASGSAFHPLQSSAVAMQMPIRKENVPSLTRVYRDKFLTFTNMPVDADTAAPQGRLVNIYIKFKRPLVVTYSANTGAFHNDVHLFFSAISDSTAVPNPGFTSGFVTATYTDF